MKSLIWITRAAPGAQATAARVAALGHEALVAPLLEVRPVGSGEIDLARVCALAFTSANAVRLFAARVESRALPVFAVGSATASAAKTARFRSVLSTEGNVRTLAAGIATRRRELRGVVLHPGAAEPAGDLAAALAEAGVEARGLTVYETVDAEPGPHLAERWAEIAMVLVHSPKAGRRLAEILAATPGPAMRGLCLSPEVAATLKDAPLKAVQAATLPEEEALLSLIPPPGARKTT